MQLGKPFYKRHHDDQGYDEIRIKVNPRYKTSGLSGDEWRVSASLEMWNKGELLFQRTFMSIQTAVNALPWFFMVAGEPGVAPDDFNEEAVYRAAEKCCQPGCSNDPCSEYKIKQEYSDRGEKLDASEQRSFPYHRRFCEKHLRRGDCGLEDADDNYEIISGPGPNGADWEGADIRESAQVIVNCDSLENIGNEIAQVMKEGSWDTKKN